MRGISLILSSGSGSKAPVTMEPLMSKDEQSASEPGRRIDFADFTARLIHRREELGRIWLSRAIAVSAGRRANALCSN